MFHTMINGYSVLGVNNKGTVIAFDDDIELIESYGYADLYDEDLKYFYIDNEELKKIDWGTKRTGRNLYPVIARTQDGQIIAEHPIRNH